jgi:hypothetical protein
LAVLSNMLYSRRHRKWNETVLLQMARLPCSWRMPAASCFRGMDSGFP